MFEDDVDEEGKMTIASVLTEVTVTVAVLDEDEPVADDALDDIEDDWEEHRVDKERTTSREVNAMFGACSRRPDVERNKEF